MKAFYQALLIGTYASIGSAIGLTILARRDRLHHRFSTPPPAENDVVLQRQDFLFAK